MVTEEEVQRLFEANKTLAINDPNLAKYNQRIREYCDRLVTIIEIQRRQIERLSAADAIAERLVEGHTIQ